MSDAIVIVDSSDDEEIPKKMQKLENNNSSLRIVLVESLKNSSKVNDVVVIDDDDYENDQVTGNNDKNEANEAVAEKVENLESVKKKTNVSSANVSMKSIKATPIPNKTPSFETFEDASSTPNVPPSITTEFQKFLDTCINPAPVQKYHTLIVKKLPAIKTRYAQAAPAFVVSKHFLKLLTKRTELIENNPSKAIIYFNEIYQELGARRKRDVELTEREELHLKKLNKVLRTLNKNIHKLEETPINWDEDENSAYMQLERYRNRFCLVYNKICMLTKENPYASRTIYSKLDFSTSKHPAINHTIDKLYKKTKSFPTYELVEKTITKCVEENKLNLSDDALQLEIKTVFQALGKLIQKRRKAELHVTLNEFLDASVDPAAKDPQLSEILDNQYKQGEEKIEELLESFTKRQLKEDYVDTGSNSDENQSDSDVSILYSSE